jgi:signal transduction histidine kinase
MGEQTVLVAGEGDTEALSRALDGRAATPLASVTSLEGLFDALCYDTVGTLVVSGPVEGAPGMAVVRGLRGLYPDLPVVVLDGRTERHDTVDPDGQTSDERDDESNGEPDDEFENVTVVDAAELADERVVAAVLEALSAGSPGPAGRSPSPLETLAMSMFDSFPDHLYAKDESARHVVTSNATVQTSDVLGRTDEALDDSPDEHTRRSVDDDRYVIAKGKPLVEREEYTDAGDQHALTSKLPWYGPDGSVTGLVGVTRDITSRKNQERTLRQQNERLAKIAIVAAHELRNELQVAAGRFDLATEDPEHAAVVADALTQLESITDDVVRLANAETEDRDEETVWLSTPAREVWEALPTDEARLEVTNDRLVVADPRALRLFFEILLSIALEHGGKDVTVTLTGSEDGFSVADDGAGIDLDPPERVFDVGFEIGGGDVGIGLYVARRIAADHGWSLEATNREEGGSQIRRLGRYRPASRRGVKTGQFVRFEPGPPGSRASVTLQLERLVAVEDVDLGVAAGRFHLADEVVDLDLDGRERVVVHRERVVDVEPVDGDGPLPGPHREVVADRDRRRVGLEERADDVAHLGHQAGVARVVERRALGVADLGGDRIRDDIARGRARRVFVVGADTVGVVRPMHRHVRIAEFDRPAHVESDGVFGAVLVFDVGGEFRDARDGRRVDERADVGDVVAVSVCQQDVIRVEVGGVDLGERVVEKRVDEQIGTVDGN